jgi:hypothetical protein
VTGSCLKAISSSKTMETDSKMLPGISEQELLKFQLSVGKTSRSRRPYSPVECGSLCIRSLEAGATRKMITAALDMTDTGMISKFIAVKKNLIPSATHLIDWGHSGATGIGFSCATIISRFSAADQELICEAAIRSSLSRDEVRSIEQLLERSGDSLTECIERVLNRRPVTVARYMSIGIVTGNLLHQRLQTLTQKERNNILNEVIKELVPSALNADGKLGIKKFTIVGNRSAMDSLIAVQGLEKSISEALHQKITTS